MPFDRTPPAAEIFYVGELAAHPRMQRPLLLVLFSSLLLVPARGPAQKLLEKVTDFFEFNIGKDRPGDSTYYRTNVVAAPVITYEPSTSLGLGIGAKMLFKFPGAGLETRTSNLPISISYTLRNQIILFSGFTVFFNRERYLLKGQALYLKYPLNYFGVGSDTRNDDVSEITFDQFLFEPLLLKRLKGNLFVGGGIRYNTIYNTRLNEDHEGEPEGTSLQDSLGSTSAGLELAITYDSRDNVLNAHRGNFLEFTHGFYGTVAGGTNEFMLTKLDIRQYVPISVRRPDDVLALEWYTRISWNDTPPLELSALGGPELLRGFQEGRFRDRITFYAQAEYRWQALERVGLVFFGGAGDVTERLQDLQLENLKYSLGTGLRLKIVKEEDLNIRIDYALGFGEERDRNFYLGIAEAF